MGDISTHVSSTDGTVYLRTQHGDTAEEIAEALKPYVGRRMSADVANRYGHFHRYSVVLRSVDGENVTLDAWVNGKVIPTTVDAMSAFGTHCTMISPEREA